VKFIGIMLLMVLGLAVVGGLMPHQPAPPEPPYAERVEAACRDKFAADGEGAINACRLRLLSDRLREIQDDKIERAARMAR
jgi:hypothetical protein